MTASRDLHSDAQRIDPLLVEKARGKFDEIVAVAAGEARVFDDDRCVFREFWDALDKHMEWLDELGLKEEFDSDLATDCRMVRLAGVWRPVEQRDTK
jgi:hypothetical protein